MEINLDYVAKRLKKTLLWNDFRIETALRKYKNFLLLIHKYGFFSEHPLVPTNDIDEAWHAHILHTKEYMEDTKRLFGGYLHHAPAREYADAQQNILETERMQRGFIFTAVLYEQEFGEPYLAEESN